MSSSASPSSENQIMDLRDDDVLLGRGTGPTENMGNIRFRILVHQVLKRACSIDKNNIDFSSPYYASTPELLEVTTSTKMKAFSAAEKQRLAGEIVQTINLKGGRFLGERSPTTKSFQEVSEDVAITKTKQSFRHQMKRMEAQDALEDESENVTERGRPTKIQRTGEHEAEPTNSSTVGEQREEEALMQAILQLPVQLAPVTPAANSHLGSSAFPATTTLFRDTTSSLFRLLALAGGGGGAPTLPPVLVGQNYYPDITNSLLLLGGGGGGVPSLLNPFGCSIPSAATHLPPLPSAYERYILTMTAAAAAAMEQQRAAAPFSSRIQEEHLTSSSLLSSILSQKEGTRESVGLEAAAHPREERPSSFQACGVVGHTTGRHIPPPPVPATSLSTTSRPTHQQFAVYLAARLGDVLGQHQQQHPKNMRR